MTCGSAVALARPLQALLDVGVLGGFSDGQLLDRFATGPSKSAELAFQTLVERHGPMVLAVCRRMLDDPNDAEDAFQATFLVLLRRATSIRHRASLASWLHGVAMRVAARTKVEQARRRRIEARGTRRTAGSDASGHRQEVELLVHEELDRLPEKYRAVIVLCYLEGLTREAAANQLGWPIGTVRGRLSRARDLLRARLTRRGVTPIAALAAIDALSHTTRAAVQLNLNRVIDGSASARVVAWSQAGHRTLPLFRWKIAAKLLLLMGTLGTGLSWVIGSARPALQGPQINPAPPTSAREANLRELFRLKGTWTRQVTRNSPRTGLPDRADTYKLIWSIDRDLVTTSGEEGFSEDTYRITLDPNHTPKTIDLTNINMGITLPGIYRIDGDSLTICYGYGPTGARPTEFREGSNQFQVLFHRESRVPTQLASEYPNAPGCYWAAKPWDLAEGMLGRVNSVTGQGMQVITKQGPQGDTLVTMAYLANRDGDKPSMEYRPVAFDDKGARHIAERGLGGSSESPAKIGTLLVMYEYHLNLPFDQIKKLGIEMMPAEVLRANEIAMSDNAFQEARHAGIELLPRPDVGKPYNFSLTAADGRFLRSDALKGTVVLIDCWASSAASYLETVPRLKRLYQRHCGEGFQVIGLNFDKERSVGERLVKALNLPWPQVFVPAGDLRTLRLWSEGPGFPSYPRFLLIDNEGILRWDGASPEELDQRIRALVQEPRSR